MGKSPIPIGRGIPTRDAYPWQESPTLRMAYAELAADPLTRPPAGLYDDKYDWCPPSPGDPGPLHTTAELW